MLRYAQFILWEGFWFRTLAQRAARAGASRSALVLRQFCFWHLRNAQLGMARRAALPCISDFVSGVGAARAGGLRGAQ
ncbi:hypothetical protein A2U01_0072679, partial [Trifolium medium]|nr:hypothetical protein [Trifolium medium]